MHNSNRTIPIKNSSLNTYMDIHQQRILILDFGSQYSQLIARRVRDAGVYCELHPYDFSADDIKKFNPQGIILSGSPETVLEHTTPRAPDIVFKLNCPVLGICYGMQTMAAQLGGEVESSDLREFGYAQVKMLAKCQLFNEIEDHINAEGDALLDVWMSHGDHVVKVPSGFVITAASKNAPIAAMSDEKRRFYGVQFHPEVTHTLQGARILERFVIDICGCQRLWTSENIIEDLVQQIRSQVGDDQVLLGLSGGVDSTVVAVLLQRAIGKQLTCVFIDNGLLRLNEVNQVLTMFNNHWKIPVIHVDAERQFLNALSGVSEPEEKRKIIGREFIEVFDAEAKKLKNVKWLAQGTIYPDVIESASTSTSKKAQVIKTHHNVGGLPERMNLKLLEPIRELFKDEVRKLGLQLGLPYDMVYRHPFPGPGLGVRILGEVKREYADTLRKADAIFIEELIENNLYHEVSQAFVVFLPVKSVGVMGDARKYEHVVSLRAVKSVDFMTAHWCRLPYDVLEKVSNRIMNEVPGISRVVYDISGKPPATIEWE
jgi:GMP synthase (glutamine-hydrolysing)